MSDNKKLLKLGVDIGGTFTDIFLTEVNSGKYWIGKKLTTHKDPSSGVIGLIKELLKNQSRNLLIMQYLRKQIKLMLLIVNQIFQ